LILSVLGIAVGTGNIWRFPRIAAQNGGDDGAGAFLLVWVAFLVAWSLPLIIAEYALGRMGRMGVIGTFVRLGGKTMAPLGGFVGFVAAAIMFYYSVVSGWCFFYLGHAVSAPLPTSTEAAKATWDAFQAGSFPLLLHGLAMGLGTLAVRRGVASIERLNRILIPSLLLIVVVSAVRAVTLPGASEGLAYLFRFEPSQLANPNIWLEALTQNAWDTGAGWGLILCYGAYMSRRDTVVKNAVITGVANNTVSLLAAATVFGTVFALLGAEMSRTEVLAVLKDSGPASTGLTFIWMPQLFAKMQGGRLLAIVFFLGLSFAALSSLLSMIELSTRTLVDIGMTRERASTLVGIGGFALGVPSAVDLDVLSNQDFVWGVALMLSGLFIARLVTTRGTAAVREQFRGVADDWDPGPAWELWMRWVVPILAVALLLWWLFLSATVYAPETWWDPTDPFSLMTCLVQWGLVLAALAAMRRRLADSLEFPPES
jgi:NSS family neurotransmitter:Na+ symporter